MKNQQIEDIIKFLKKNIEPLNDTIYGPGYRAAVYLKDGTYIPCVIFRNPNLLVNLAIRRFKEEQNKKSFFSKFSSSSSAGYYNIVKNFVTNGNCINYYDIDSVEESKYAFPLNIQKQIQGETTMGWTGFAVKMKDAKYFAFGSSFRWEFFQIPQNYSVNDIEEIINHSYVIDGQLMSHRNGGMTFPDDYKQAIIYREKPYFECYIDNL
ncbi:hypothetical protein LZZ90_13775 [Flavobacterium sp. SM15]|uniref:hypothetical protein n=1 Tax=Flavobacterium sp. SM15 TaxID=2908005 RepID=UPI001EDC67F3|nr:hypothetical protein [Flavobacterium sp. SM15]MCG2612579.1 hypothetical protein [Flavobacterium sp. SM15]